MNASAVADETYRAGPDGVKGDTSWTHPSLGQPR